MRLPKLLLLAAATSAATLTANIPLAAQSAAATPANDTLTNVTPATTSPAAAPAVTPAATPAAAPVAAPAPIPDRRAQITQQYAAAQTRCQENIAAIIADKKLTEYEKEKYIRDEREKFQETSAQLFAALAALSPQENATSTNPAPARSPFPQTRETAAPANRTTNAPAARQPIASEDIEEDLDEEPIPAPRKTTRAARASSYPAKAPKTYADRKGIVGIGPRYYRMNFSSSRFQGIDVDPLGVNLYGFSLFAGGSFAHTKVGQVRLQGDIGFYWGTERERYTTYAYDIRGKENDFAFDLMFTPSYEFNLATPHARIRIGPTLGFAFLRSERSVSGHYGYVNYYNDSDFNAVGVSFAYGAEVGFTVTPKDSFFLDFSYRYTRNSASMEYKGFQEEERRRWDGHRVAFSFGWRF